VTFDNVRGVVKSSVLEGLLTTAEWSDRLLAKNQEMYLLRNDRLWVMTSNNAALGGDLSRRVLPIEVDPGMPNPHLRPASNFKLNLKKYVPKHRGEILAAMLTMARGWILDGRPEAGNARSDDYAEWTANLAGLITWAKIPGTFGGVAESTSAVDTDADEWSGFCIAMHANFKDAVWTVKSLVQALNLGHVDPGALPEELAHKWSRVAPTKGQYGVTTHDQSGFSKSLGKWLLFRAGRYAHGWKVERVGDTSKGSAMWQVTPPPV
jgi:hypothetical protein